MIPFARIDGPLDLAPLRAELSRLLQAPWYDHVNQRDYRGGWDVLPLRCQREHLSQHPILQSFAIGWGDDWADLPVLQTLPALRAVLDRVHAPLQAARLMRLKAGAEIRPHRDAGLGIDHGLARLHLPLQTSEHVQFIVGGQVVPMAPGELWYFDADQVHEVHNRGDQDRIHLVIDCTANDWLRERVHGGVVPSQASAGS
ncbi:aspartyl/asparaginyl beta-hydroxylase domain-containing protein [Arenimonas sp. MALMAid1274]|uniref:aspartyl/asparaginyl beta-hydroxylase domain-containing protein n=1 Tax=Arenimonas sp. MALMAid1274 TaxID=3411630 RepID=UPI003BA174A3